MFALSTLTTKFASFIAAVAVTAAMLGSIDGLAVSQHGGAEFAAKAAATQVAAAHAVRASRI